MDLTNYPFDIQHCHVFIAVFGYYDYQVKLSWRTPGKYLRPPRSPEGSPLQISPDIKLSNFEIVDVQFATSQTSNSWAGKLEKPIW